MDTWMFIVAAGVLVLLAVALWWVRSRRLEQRREEARAHRDTARRQEREAEARDLTARKQVQQAVARERGAEEELEEAREQRESAVDEAAAELDRARRQRIAAGTRQEQADEADPDLADWEDRPASKPE
jgi:FtsZ-interacting cell division protein ZipA